MKVQDYCFLKDTHLRIDPTERFPDPHVSSKSDEFNRNHLYESRRFTTLAGDDAVMIHPKAEKWLMDRIRTEETIHVKVGSSRSLIQSPKTLMARVARKILIPASTAIYQAVVR